MPRSRKKEINIATTKTGEKISSCYCRKCMQEKNPKDFFNATDTYLDSNGKFSICKDCINEIYNKVYAVEKSIPKTLYKICKILNVFYSDSVVDMAVSHGNKFAERDLSPSIFGLYISKLMTFGKENGIIEFTFSENVNVNIQNPEDGMDDDDKDKEEMIQNWGENLSYEDYAFLEREFDGWTKTHKCGTWAEQSLLRELCHLELVIRKTRLKGDSTGNLVKQKQELMKTASVDPAKASLANSGQSQDTFSAFIKTIEVNEPAELYKLEEKQLFKDFDDIDFYFKKYVTRPLSNFCGLTRDFNVTENEDSLSDDFEIDEQGELNET
jgi:hypothetical protein